MPTMAKLRSLFLPVSIGVLVILAAGLYNFAWLPTQHNYLDNRNFRLLSTLGGEISTSINTFDKMMDNAADSHVAGNDTKGNTSLEGYLKEVAPRLESVDIEDQEMLGKDFDDPPSIAVRADEGTHFLYFAFKRTREKNVNYAVKTDLDSLISGFLPPANRNPFDVVLVAQSDGTVIFQSSSPGLAVTRIDALEDESSAAKTAKSDTEGPKTDKPGSGDVKTPPRSKWYSSNRFLENNLAGKPYRIYSQPLPLSFRLNDPARKQAERAGPPGLPEKWVLCGLVRSEAFRAESESISYTYFLWFSAAILLTLLAPPFLKLLVSASTERMRAREVAVSGVFTCIVAAIVTFMLLDLFHWRRDFEGRAQEQMKGLAADIDTNFIKEKEAAFEQLHDFAGNGVLHKALVEAQASVLHHPELRPHFGAEDGECSPKSACRVRILKVEDSSNKLLPYPYLQFASWSDWNGDQRVKWTIREHATPFINLNDGTIPYFPAMKKAMEYPGLAPARGIGTQYSPNTGYNITIFWQLMTVDGKPITSEMSTEEKKNVVCASIVTRPISVSEPILPADFQFAIVNGNGLVIFHSDASRNLRENFFAETDQNKEIRSRVVMRSEGALAASYIGRNHRMYIRPMEANADELWSVIVFRDLRIEQTMNVEVLSLATILFLLYAAVAAVAAGLTLWVLRSRRSGRWLWPDSRKAATYKRLAIINGFAILLLLVLSEIPLKLALLFCAVCFPVGVLVWNLVTLNRDTERSSPVDVAKNITPSRWRLGYAGTCATLVAVVAVLPCLSFFKMAWDFEQKLFIERSQLRLIDDARTRRQIVQSFYEGVSMGEFAKQLLAEPQGQELGMNSYQKRFLGTETRSAEEFEISEIVHCGLGSAATAERCADSFLGAISPPYNQLAADNRSLAVASTYIWRWSSTSGGDKELLQLQRQEGENEASIVKSELASLHLPWGSWQWWLGCVAFLVTLFLLAYYGLGRVFLLDIDAPDDPAGADQAGEPFDPARLLATLSKNLVIIGRSSSPTLVNFSKREDVQRYDLSQPLLVPLRRAASQGGSSSEASAISDPIENIVRNGRPVVFYNFESGLEGREHSQQKLATLEGVLSRLPQKVVLASNVDPVANAPEAEREQWQTMLRTFVQIDLNSSPAQSAQETPDQFERRLSADAYYRWLFSGRTKAQKLALVHLAQEKVVNPNCGEVVRELNKQGLVVRRWGMFSVKDQRFAHFLKTAVPRESIENWEKQGAGIHASALRTSLVVGGIGVAGFLLYTQGAIFNTWITYMTGLAAAVPAVMRLFQLFRPGGEAQAH